LLCFFSRESMNEDQIQKEEGAQNFELVPLGAGQHAVTPVAKFTTELPFFYLTKQKKLLQKDIRYEGKDAYGNPVRWEVIPNRSPRIGVPTIEAHSIFTRLIKPKMEMHRAPDGQIPEILPLGGIRACLRTVGWKEGGWEARGLLQGLMQIGQATCDFDFLLPTGETDGEGKPLFKSIKGIFNRFSIWKIGSKHVSEEELAAGNFQFDFDLDDTLYIQLHKVERDIQRSQDQRYLDNQYMFSVRAAARRWYELMAAKVFGVVKNGGSHCEIQYSWYVKHHHTLMRFYSRGEAATQMNRVVSDHIASGFINRIEYRTIKDESGVIDLLIRYYPGVAAKESVTRVLSFINSSTLPIIISRRKKRREKNQPPPTLQTGSELQLEANASAALPTTPTIATVDQKLLAELVARGIWESEAVKLASFSSSEQLERVGDCIDYWDSIRTKKQPGLLIRLIQANHSLPGNFETRRQRADRIAAEDRRQKLNQVEKLVEERYKNFCRKETDSYLTGFPVVELERQVAEYKADLMSEQGILSKPETADQFARNAVRARIAAQVTLPTPEDFRRQQLPGILAELQLDPAEFGIEALSESDSAGGEPPAALYAPPSNDQPQSGDSPNL
jgi:hypothetical protein